MPLVVPGVARFSVNQSFEGRSVVNVLDYFIDTTGSTMSRNDAVRGQAESIIEQWAALVTGPQTDQMRFDSVSFVDLDSATGVTGSVVTSGATTLPVSGQQTGAGLPANVSVLVTKQVAAARGRRNGRMYVAGLTEVATTIANPNVLEATSLASLQSTFDSFLANTNELDSVGTAFSSNMVVVSVTARDIEGNPTAGIGTVVDDLVVDDTLATQRRRLRG